MFIPDLCLRVRIYIYIYGSVINFAHFFLFSFFPLFVIYTQFTVKNNNTSTFLLFYFFSGLKVNHLDSSLVF